MGGYCSNVVKVMRYGRLHDIYITNLELIFSVFLGMSPGQVYIDFLHTTSVFSVLMLSVSDSGGIHFTGSLAPFPAR